MEALKWKTIKETFSAVLELPPSERSAILDSTDAEIRREVEMLLAAHAKAENFIDKPVLIESGLAEDEPEDKFVGRKIESYLILEKIGAGGMGAVYLAERQNSDFKQKVAVKVIKRGMDSEAILKRFANERKILSSLKHPNIAQLIDGGISSENLPFFVMEFVEGKPLNSFCGEEKLSLEERLEIFRQICSAVEHAHKNLVIHRDLKPTNILVTEDRIPKLLDFGIAKLLASDDSETTITMTHGKIFTPEYASPEQILGKIVTTSTDVYSLGVILYELLTRHRPFETKGKSFDEIVKSVCETEPPRPSDTVENQALTAQNDPETIQIPKNSLRGDLDNIVLKALRKEPAERYGSVQQFSEDISMYLKGLPVMARPQTARYRFGKYFRRHRVGVLAAALVLLSLMAGISGATWQAIVAGRERARAEQRFDDVRQLANTILFDHYERIKNLPGATDARAKLVSDALLYLDKISADSSDNPDLQRDLIAAYRKLATIQGSPLQGANLGDTTAARENFLKALAIAEKLSAGRNSTNGDKSTYGKLLLDISDLYENENERPMQSEYAERGLSILRTLRDENPGAVESQADFANALWTWANIVRLQGDNRGAIDVYKQALEIYENLGRGTENRQKFKRNAALTYKNIGTIYSLENDFENALDCYHKAYSYDKAAADDLPDNVEVQMDLSFSYRSLGEAFQKVNEFEKTIDQYERALAIQKLVVGRDPKNKFAANSLFNTYARLGDVFSAKGDFKAADDYFQLCVKWSEASMSKPENAGWNSDHAVYFKDYGRFLMKKAEAAKNNNERLENFKLARKKMAEAESIFAKLEEQKVLDPAYIKDLSGIKESLAKIDAKLKLSGEK